MKTWLQSFNTYLHGPSPERGGSGTASSPCPGPGVGGDAGGLGRFSMAGLLGCALVLLLTGGCQTGQKPDETNPDKQETVLRVHLEAGTDPSAHIAEVPVFRRWPVQVRIIADSFLNEGNVITARVEDDMGGFRINIELDRQGRLLLEQFTGAYRGRRLGIFASFTEDRWLAAPLIQNVVTNGHLVFTPDATREESDRIVRGLNNVAKETKHDPRF
jgi:hypothetical protein